MSYIPTEWQTGDIVTAEKLNKLEEGVASGGSGGGGLVVTMTVSKSGNDWTVSNVSESVMDIYSAASNGTPVFADIAGLGASSHLTVQLAYYYAENGEYGVSFFPRYEEVIDGVYSATHYSIGGYTDSEVTDDWFMDAEANN